MIEIVEILRAISPGDWYGYDRYQAGKFEAGFLLDREQEPELREFARLNASGLAEQIGNILARAHEAAKLIETLTAENAALKAAKWDVQHADTANTLVQMGMARDAAEAESKRLREAGQFLLWQYDRKGPLADCAEAWAQLRAAIGDAS